MNPETPVTLSPETIAKVKELHASLEPKPEVPVAALKPTRGPVVSEELVKQWNDLVRHLVRKSRGLKPEDEVQLPGGLDGKYVAYALDKDGRLSTGKRHG